ncbi:hypothetical protein WME79_38575 [Sorangium sp. So ce726]|uniref:hypothetical protein n=1 Tax=Sorangium sp. So ce726 TaxID=3133319 RepID=UPI003F63DCBB
MMEPPSPDTTAPPSRSDALDALEARALDLCRSGDESAEDALLAAIERAEHDEERGLYPQPPPIDPSEGRRSSAELRRLLQVLRGVPPSQAPARTRAGYALEGAPAGEAHVIPAFIAALGCSGKLREAFPDLWAVDGALWERLDHADVRELARLWLESPGRRLVQDLNVLARMPSPKRLGATDLSASRVDAAAGLRSDAEEHPPDLPRSYHELHSAVPGEVLSDWEPQPLDGTEQILRGLHLLEAGRPLSLRGAALAWLLNRAADDPFYIVDGIRRDLRDDLPVRLSAAVAGWLGDALPSAVPRQLEMLALQHAARLIDGDVSMAAARRSWAIARWLQGCLRRSPFFGADEEVLAAHLRARLPEEPLPVPRDADALHPARFTFDETGLDIAEVSFIAGVLAHYGRAQEHTLLPTPVPLVHALQRIASHEVRNAEEEADRALVAGRNALGWPADYSIASALAARQLMTELRIGWLAQVDGAAQLDSIERFATDPTHHAWVAYAIQREGQHLRPAARARAVEVFRALANTRRAPAHVLGTFGTGLLDEIIDDEAEGILDLAASADPQWRPFVVDALAGAAERLSRAEIWVRALDCLLDMMENRQLDDKTRLNAALFALRRASASKTLGRDAMLGRIASAAAIPPFSDHLGLRREIRRLGVAGPAPTRSKR